MSQHNDDDDDNVGHNDYGDSHGTSSARGRFGNTSDFNTTLISDDGRFLGIKLSSDMASQLRTFYPALLDWARRKGEHYGIPWAEKFAKSALNYSEQDASHFGGKAGNVIGYGIILSNQLFDVGRNVYDSVQSFNDLRSAVRPLNKSGDGSISVAPLSGNNEVVANARSKINGVFWHRLAQTATGAIATAPALAIKWNEQAVKNLEREKQLAYERALNDPDPKAMAKVIEGKDGDHSIKLEAEKHAKALRVTVEERRKIYENSFEDFKDANLAVTNQELDKAIEELNPTKKRSNSKKDSNPKNKNIDYQIDELKRLGFNTSGLERQLRGNEWNNEHFVPPDETKTDEILASYKDIFKKQKDRLAEETLKKKFVLQEGAFDETWKRYLPQDSGYEDRKQLTIKQGIEEEFSNFRKARQKTHDEKIEDHKARGHSGKSSDISGMAAGLGAGFVAEFVTKIFAGKTLAKYAKPIALDRILHLRRVLEQAKDEPPEQVPGYPKTNEKDVGYVQYVHDIFQQHQRDCNRTEIGDRFIEHFEKAHWNDSAIQQLSDEELTPYEYAVKTIAKRLNDGRMDAIALLTLVGDKQKKIVRDDGRSFGPHGAGKDDESVKKTILKVIDEQTMLLHAAQEKTDAEINDKLGNFIFSIADLKRALESKDMDKHERAFVFTVFSDVVGSDKKLCHQIGISEKHCQELRTDCKECFDSMLDGAVIVLAEMIENDPEGLSKKIKLTDKERELLLSLADKVKADNKNVADLTENREEIKTLETVVANALMSLRKEVPVANGEEKPPGFWQRLLGAAKTVKDKPKPSPKSKDMAEGRFDEGKMPGREDKASDVQEQQDEDSSYTQRHSPRKSWSEAAPPRKMKESSHRDGDPSEELRHL